MPEKIAWCRSCNTEFVVFDETSESLISADGHRHARVDCNILDHDHQKYVAKMVELFREVRRVIRNDGTLWINLGDSYAGNCSRVSSGRAGLGAERARNELKIVREHFYNRRVEKRYLAGPITRRLSVRFRM